MILLVLFFPRTDSRPVTGKRSAQGPVLQSEDSAGIRLALSGRVALFRTCASWWRMTTGVWWRDCGRCCAVVVGNARSSWRLAASGSTRVAPGLAG
ncbi:hypothetical protein UK99_13360 [Frankia casuarinae]|nr:hypothetical protein UK99_13360 [Frankia casuarinae]